MLAALLAALSAFPAAPRPLEPVPFTRVRVADAFFAPRIETNRARTLPHCLDTCERTGRLANFRRAAGREEGPFQGIYFNDSDVYKAIEGAAYALASRPDGALEARIDAIIDDIAAAQRPDGYLNTYYTLAEPAEKRFTDLAHMHELYCAGHLIEAAVAHHQATGKRTLLDVALKLAAHVDSVFGPGKRAGVPGHEEIELALVKLHRLTSDRRWLDLAAYFIDERGGKASGRKTYGEYCQDHLPVREQDEIVGHAVRAMYLYAGATDVAALTGDAALADAMDALWEDVVGTKMYATGGIGSSARNEGFTRPYDLPNRSAYAETCAAIGLALWNQRLLLLHRDAKYADVLERVLYNGLLAGVSMDGERFFYVNPLESRGGHHRQPWFDCACCPVNVVRYLPSIGGAVYASLPDEGVWVNLFVAGEARIPLAGGEVRIEQETRYPWDGRVTIRVSPEGRPAARFRLHVRIPGWCGADSARAAVAGRAIDVKNATRRGFLEIDREWRTADAVEIEFDMPPRRVVADPAVEANRGRVALARGPLVYCLEAADHGDASLETLFLPRDAAIEAKFEPDLLNGVTVLVARGGRALPGRTSGPGGLYSDAAPIASNILTAVPYCAWDHREPGAMLVWIPESPAFARAPRPPSLAAGAKPSASHCFERDTVAALNDGVEPSGSNDHSIPRFTWWDRKGGTEWVQLDFDPPRTVSRTEIYWFDDGSGCRLPTSWRLLHRGEDGEFRPVDARTRFGTAGDRYNLVRFREVETGALRIEASLADGASGGILEWRVDGPERDSVSR